MHAHPTLRGKVADWLDGSGTIARAIDTFLITLIALNVALVLIESEPGVSDGDFGPALRVFETVSSLVFTLEYVLRLWTAVEQARFASPVRGRLRFALTPMALIDLVAIVPFWLPMFITVDLRFVRALRLFRLVRLLKIGRYAHAVNALGRVFALKKAQLPMTFFSVSLLLIVCAGLMYFVENPAQPDKFTSIPQTMWWAAATLTTVGYGDMYPITTLGQILGAFISFIGVVIIAVPAGIVASGSARSTPRCVRRPPPRRPRRSCRRRPRRPWRALTAASPWGSWPRPTTRVSAARWRPP